MRCYVSGGREGKGDKEKDDKHKKWGMKIIMGRKGFKFSTHNRLVVAVIFASIARVWHLQLQHMRNDTAMKSSAVPNQALFTMKIQSRKIVDFKQTSKAESLDPIWRHLTNLSQSRNKWIIWWTYNSLCPDFPEWLPSKKSNQIIRHQITWPVVIKHRVLDWLL